jgi:hypothetical protein
MSVQKTHLNYVSAEDTFLLNCGLETYDFL